MRADTEIHLRTFSTYSPADSWKIPWISWNGQTTTDIIWPSGRTWKDDSGMSHDLLSRYLAGIEAAIRERGAAYVERYEEEIPADDQMNL